MPRYDDLDRLEVLTVITGRLVNETPLRVGVGKEELEERQPLLGSAVDIAPITIRFADGRSVPYIPGSSMKGVLRSLAEAMVRAQGKDDVHSPWDFGEKGKIEEEAESGNYCIICGTFGSTKLASHVRVYDAYPETDALTFVKTSVGINREFRGAHPDILYTEQQVVPHVRWSFRMDVINIRVFPEPQDERGKLLRSLIGMLVDGMVQVGARRTLGYGRLRLEKGSYRVYEVEEGRLVKKAEGDVV
ncbi:MAG: RAMP superfamily CRISPR-associated protein [Candidatus Caldarchaeales archaeon]